MKRITTLLAAFCLIAISGCMTNWGNFEKISSDVPAGLEEKGARVTGTDCGLFSYWYHKSVAEAARDALRKAPGATGLKDVEVSWSHRVIMQCMVVTGTPVTEGMAPAGKKK